MAVCSTPAAIRLLGLYAAGNAMAAVTAMVYGGGGGTLGPAVVFGYRAGRHAAASSGERQRVSMPPSTMISAPLM